MTAAMGRQCKEGLRRGQNRGGEPILANKMYSSKLLLLTVALCTLGSLNNNTMVDLCALLCLVKWSSDRPGVTLANRSAFLPSSKPHAARLLRIIRESGSHRKNRWWRKNKSFKKSKLARVATHLRNYRCVTTSDGGMIVFPSLRLG